MYCVIACICKYSYYKVNSSTIAGAQDTSNANQSWQQQQQQHQQQQQQEQQADATAQQWGQQDASGDATAAQQTWQQQQEEWERVQEQARQNGYVWNAHTQQWDVIATEALQQDATGMCGKHGGKCGHVVQDVEMA